MPTAFATALVLDVERPCKECRQTRGAARSNWSVEGDFRCFRRCFLRHRNGSVLIRFNYLEQTQRFYVGGSGI